MIRKTFGFALIILALFLFFAYYVLYTPNNLKKPYQFEIKKGDFPSKILKNLKKERIIFCDKIPYFYLLLTKNDKKIKAGEYLIEPKLNTIEIIKKFIEGKTIQIPVTFKEGWTIEDYGIELSKKGICSFDNFIKETKKVPQWIGADDLEGFLFPETYYFSKDMEAKEIVFRLHKTFLDKTKELREKLKYKNISLTEWVTLASIVEKEAKLEDEKPRIAGVFLNRLNKKMRLEADPTVIYGMRKAGIDVKILSRNDLKFNSNYNTYIIFELPPGPICNPSYSSLKAVLYPEEHKFYYFVSKGDGSHYFSLDLKEHIKAINLYR